MNEQMITRLAMVLQNQAPSTLDKYICKLTENVLIDYPNGLTLVEIENEIKDKFSLSFSIPEIKNAITKKSKKRIKYNNEVYYIEENIRTELLKQEPLMNKLHYYVCEFLKSNSKVNTTIENAEKVLLEYLYFCFNSNVNNLLNLLNQNNNELQYSKEISSEDIGIINEFISWNNNEKNEFVYNVVAICYEYCMLTIKNDNILSTELFNGKKFYLDSNIIFRIAGINKDERKFVINSFIKHCKKVGIKLCCTSVTVDEIYRVLEAQISYIKGITHEAPPVSPETLSKINPSYEVNDFYILYYDWSQTQSNDYSDYDTFYHYLLELIRLALEKVDILQVQIENYTNGAHYENNVRKLREYKNTHNSWHTVSKASAETDIINICEINSKRAINSNSIWQTNEFIVSADQLLISWTSQNYSGVPIVVLPSVWLSIILKFTGRTSDDYNSFCLFLTQRQHVFGNNKIDPMSIVKSINKKTTKSDIRDRIIVEITEHKSDYAFVKDEDYDICVDRAFDKVVEKISEEANQKVGQMKEALDNQLGALAESSRSQIEYEKAKADERERIAKITEREKTIVFLAKQKASKKVKKFRWLSDNTWLYYVVGIILTIFAIVVTLTKVKPFWGIVNYFLANQDYSELQVSFITFLFGLIPTAIAELIMKILELLGSENHEKNIYEKECKKLKSDIDKIDNKD